VCHIEHRLFLMGNEQAPQPLCTALRTGWIASRCRARRRPGRRRAPGACYMHRGRCQRSRVGRRWPGHLPKLLLDRECDLRVLGDPRVREERFGRTGRVPLRGAIPVRRRADGDRHCAQDAGFLLLADARFHLVYSRWNVHRLASAVRHEQTAEQCSNIAVRVNAHTAGCS
jgi:hypothetical protein